MEYCSLSENYTVSLLRKNGFVILGRNRHIEGVEIDILARRNQDYYFIEVKQVRRENFFNGYPPISYNQWRRYHKAVFTWSCIEKPESDVHISVMILDEKLEVIEFIEDYNWNAA